MSEIKTIDQKSTLWNNKMAITFVISLIIGTNAASVFMQQQKRNTEQIEYNKAADKRRLNNAIREHELEQQVLFLKFKLDECNEKSINK